MDTPQGPPVRAPSPSDPATPRAYDAPAVVSLLASPHAPHREVPRARQIFVNRNLRMDKVEAVGFDMDYTLAIYHLRRLEKLSFRMTLDADDRRARLPRGDRARSATTPSS